MLTKGQSENTNIILDIVEMKALDFFLILLTMRIFR